MPDWKAPFHLPRLNSADFAAMKAKYIAKHGYTVTYPGMEDFIKIEISKPVTDEEQKHWIEKDFSFFTEVRIKEIHIFKRKRRERFLRMLASPTPQIFNARGSIIGALDDAEDAISTLAVLGKLAVRILSPSIASLVSGPIGWLMTTANLLNLATTIITPEVPKRVTKRQMDALTALNPKSRKARWKKANVLSQKGFTGGEVLQLAQVTENVFGIGISLGAFMAFPIDLLSGVARGVAGQDVEFKVPPLDIPYWNLVAKKALKAICCMLTAPTKEFIPAFDETVLTAHLAAQIDSAFTDKFTPSDDVVEPSKIESQAPTVTNLITREVIEELNENPDEGISWPSTGQRWSTYTDISNSGYENATNNFASWNRENQYNTTSFLASINAVQGAHYMGECITGIDTIEYDFTATNKYIHSLTLADYAFPHYYNIAQHTPDRLLTSTDITNSDGNIQKPPFPEWRIPFGNIQNQLQDPLFQQTLFKELINLAKRLNPDMIPEIQANVWKVNFRHRLTNIEYVWNHLANLGRYLDALEAAGQNPDTGNLVITSHEQFGFPMIYSPVISEQGEIKLLPQEVP